MSNPKPPSRTQARASKASGLSKKDLARQAALGTSTSVTRPGSATERLMKAEPHGTRRPGIGGFGGNAGETALVAGAGALAGREIGRATVKQC